MLQDEEHQQHYGVQDLRQLVAGRRVHFQGSTRPQGNDPLLLFVEGSRNINNILSPPFPPPLLLSAPPHPPPPPHHHSYQYYDNLSNINSILGGHHLQVGGGVGGILESTPPPPCHGHGNHGWNINNVSEGDGNGNGTNSRWPRQETLTLLEIRSRLDPMFKEANQKAPLWDEVSRIMGEEHGYYRSGKKCREKFENLYKYYKKTKEGKAGRQDGKHYRFFRQLEALYGETSTTFPPQLINYATTTITPSNWSTPPHPNPTTEDDDDHEPLSIQENQQQSLSTNFSNTTTTSQELDQYQTTTSSSENNNIDIKMNNNDDQDLSVIACSMMMNRSSSSGKSLAAHDQVIKSSKKKSSYNWKVEKVKGFVELKMRRLVEAQEVWMERIVRMIEDKEKERLCREEEWTKQEVARLDGEHEVWAKERAWMEARDACFLDTFKKYTAKFTHAAGNNSASSTSCFDEDMMMKNNNLSCVGTGSTSKLAKLHEGQELWSSYELKKEMMMNKEKKPLLYK